MYGHDEDQPGTGLAEVTAELRELPGFAGMGTAPVFAQVAAAAGAAPVVYLAAARQGGLALIVRGGTVEHIPLPQLGTEVLRRRVEEHLRRYDGFRVTGGTAAAEIAWQDWADALDHTTGWLWDAAMGPVVARLGGVDAVHLVPCGLLGVLPLHAAWTGDPGTPTGRRHVVDHFAVSYLPNAQALHTCRHTADHAGTRRLLAVADPEPGDRPLPGTRMEAAVAAASFATSRVIIEAAAVRDEVAAALADADVLHLGCHGSADVHVPMRSHLRLAGGQRLELDDIMRQRLRVRLAVLTACETAMIGVDLPDEVVALPTGLLQAGAAGVVAAMWATWEQSGPMLVTEFYRRWLHDGQPPAQALRHTQRWLRDTTNRQKADWWRQALDDRAAWLPEDVGERLLTVVELREPDERGELGADRWAVFAHTGV